MPAPEQSRCDAVEVAALAEGRLRSNPYLALKSISCEYQGGTLTLRGCVSTYYLKQRAQETVSRIAGVERIANEIEVLTPAPRAALLNSPPPLSGRPAGENTSEAPRA